MKIRLNGWQRLWVILSVLYLLLVVGVTLLFWPTPATTRHQAEFITRMPAELRADVNGAYESTWHWQEAQKKRRMVWDDATTLEFPNGAVLDVHGAKEKGKTAGAYWNVVEAATRAERWTRAWQMALVWLIPCLALYALGWAVAWVRRGFATQT